MLASLAACAMAGLGMAAETPFTGIFGGAGGFCLGALHIHAQAVEWNTSYSVCETSNYEVLEEKIWKKKSHLVWLLKNPGEKCRFEIIEAQHVKNQGWNITGYPSREAFEKKGQPGWVDSALPGRQILSCSMVKVD